MEQVLLSVGFLVYPLLIISILAFAIILNKLFFYFKLPKIEESQDLKSAITTLQKNKDKIKEIRDELASYLLLEMKKSYDFGIRTLRIIATISPMVGLLGTVIGIIKVFKTISLQTAPVTPALISDGLWNAMLTTAIGISISLPCLIGAFIFSRITERRFEKYQDSLNKISFEIEGVKL